MSKFITFNGVDFFNSDKIEKISVFHREKKIDKKEYLYITVESDDCVLYESIDYKVYDEGNCENVYKSFREEMNTIIEEIKSIS